MSCAVRCLTPRLPCAFGGEDPQHACMRNSAVHSGLCVCRCGLRWDVDCVFVLEVS